MRITEQKVYTEYTIRIHVGEMMRAIYDYFHRCEDANCQIKYPKAFTTIQEQTNDGDPSKYDELTHAYLRDYISKLLVSSEHSTSWNYLADYYGFDGYKNVGYYDSRKNEYVLVVYNNGDDLNGRGKNDDV